MNSLINQYEIIINLMQKVNLNLSQPKYSTITSKEDLEILPYDHITEEDYQYVYAPNDDTFLILSALKEQFKTFNSHAILCQVGSGTGIISANSNHWLKKLQKQPLIHLSIDINMDASILSKRYYDKYNLNIQQINTSLFNNISFMDKNKPDVIIFNPPYVPVQQEEIDNQKKYLIQKLNYVKQNKKVVRKQQQNMIAYSYMGGLDGLLVTRKLIKAIQWSTILYFIVMGEKGVNTLIKDMQDGKCFAEELIWQWNIQLLHYIQLQLQQLYLLKLQLKVKEL